MCLKKAAAWLSVDRAAAAALSYGSSNIKLASPFEEGNCITFNSMSWLVT